jgi:uncharacterized protein (DUF1778 family)
MKEPALPRIRCTEELRRAVEKAAAKDGRTVSNWILKAIAEKLERSEQNAKI